MDPHATEMPEGRFARLSAYPYAAHTLGAGGESPTGLVYLDEGLHEGRPVLLVHGGPTWSYLWRRVIPSLTEASCRVLAPDLIGFGRSAKPRDPGEVTVERQVALLARLLDELEVEDGVLVFHGLSAALGLRLLAAARRRLSAVVGVCPVVSRGGGEVEALFAHLREAEALSASELVAEGCATPPPEVVRHAYDAPLFGGEPDAGLRALPSFVPDEETWAELARAADLPVLGVAGEADRLGAPLTWLDALPEGPPRERVTLAGAGHYLPEDRGPELALAILSFVRP